MNLGLQPYLQEYAAKSSIDGVQVINLPVYPSDGGDFAEYLRINEDHITIGRGESLVKLEFRPRQISRSFLMPGIIKAWHLHKVQNEVFFPTDGRFIIGLFDNRKDSKTYQNKLRIYAGIDKPLAIYIPSGVAHGYKNIGLEKNLLTYVTDQQWDGSDEWRLDYDEKTIDFNWEVENG